MERITRLVISRREGESVWIAGAKITIMRVNGSAKLSIEAPESVKILRGELAEK